MQDYIPRGTVLATTPAVATDPNISLDTNAGGMLSMAVLTKTEIDTNTHDYSVLDVNSVPIIINSAVPNSTVLAQNVKILMNVFPISPSVMQYNEYTYLKSGVVQIVSGPDDSPNSSNLRFTVDNKISVYSNGIELAPTAYVVSVPNQDITFTPAIYESNNVVNVIVYNDLTANVSASSIISLEFDVLDPHSNLPPPYVSQLAFLNTCAWGNYYAVNIPGIGTRYLMHCIDLSALSKDLSYGIEKIQIVVGDVLTNAGSFVTGQAYTITSLGSPVATDFTSVGATSNTIGLLFTATGPGIGNGTATTANTPIDVLSSEINLMLAKEPYDFQDKELNSYLNGIKFDSTFSFTYGQDLSTGIYRLTAPQSKLTQLLHPLIPDPASKPSSTLFAAQSTSGASTASSTVKHKYVIGPT